MRRLCLTLVLILSLVAPAAASVAYISDADKAPATAASFTFTSYAISGTNPVVVLLIALAGTIAAETVSSVAVSAGLTAGTPVEVKKLQTSASVIVSIWCIPAPTGTGTITVTLSASLAYQANAILMQGADQTTPCPLADGVTAAGITNPLTVTPTNLTANDAAVGAGGNAGAGDAPTFNQTQTFNDNTSAVNMAGGYHLGTGAVTVTWGTPDAVDTLVGIRVVASGGAAAVVPQNMMLGVGP